MCYHLDRRRLAAGEEGALPLAPAAGKVAAKLAQSRRTVPASYSRLNTVPAEVIEPSGLPKSRRSASAVATGIVRTGGATKCQYGPYTRKNTAVADDTF